MNNNYLFHGKRLDNGEWVEGCYAKTKTGQAYILPESSYISFEYQTIAIGGFVEVDPSTVGQYTGKTDKNGKKIFKGDICRVRNFTYQVEFRYSQWWFSIVTPLVYCCPYFDSHCGEHCEVIGNIHDIHDNPELIGGEGDD